MKRLAVFILLVGGCDHSATTAGPFFDFGASPLGDADAEPDDLSLPPPTPTCSDHIQNGNETDADCGGPDCPACGLGQKCVASSDCSMSICVQHLCRIEVSQLYAAPVYYTQDPTGTIGLGDFDGDGHLDLAVRSIASSPPFGVQAFYGDGAGNLARSDVAAATPGPPSDTMAVGDFNGDGVDDIGVGLQFFPVDHAQSLVQVFLGHPNRRLSGPVTIVWPIAPRMLGAGDFNGDGHLDLVGFGYPGPGIFANQYVALGDGSGRFGAPVTATTELADGFAVADLNLDGISDLVLGVEGHPASYTAYLGAAMVLLQAPIRSVQLDGWIMGLSNLVIGDFDRDGRADVAGVGLSQSQASCRVLLGDGKGNLTPSSTTAITGFISAAADIDGDHNLDVVTFVDTVLSFSRGDGHGGLLPQEPILDLAQPLRNRLIIDVRTGDFNGDGRPDFAVSTVSGAAVIRSRH